MKCLAPACLLNNSPPVTSGQARSRGHSVTKAFERGQMWAPLSFATVPVSTACMRGRAVLNGSPQKILRAILSDHRP